MIKSVENVIFNGVNLAERFDSDGGYFVVNHVGGRSYIPTSRDIVSVPNKAGGFAGKLRTSPRVIEIEFTLKARTYEKLRKQIEELNAVIFGKDSEVSLRFADEMDREYFGRVSVVAETFDESRIHKGTITVVCGDPYKYGMTKSIDGLTVQNNGSVDTPFLIEMKVTAPATNLTVSDGKNSLTIGKYIATTQYTEVLKANEPLEDMVGWSPINGLFSDYTESGAIVSSDASDSPYGSYYGKYFALVNVTSTGQWYGRSIVKSVGTTTDYRLESIFEVVIKNGENGIIRQYVLLVDDLGKEVGRIGITNDGGTNINRLTVRIGNDQNNVTILDSAGEIFKREAQVFCKMVLAKKGNVYKASVIRVDRATGVEIREELTTFYTDYLNLYTRPLSALAIHMANNIKQDMGIYDIKLYEYVDESVTNPYVVSTGDVVKIDMKNRMILINDQIRNVNKNIQSDYFNLSPGKNILYVSPNATGTHKISLRERYL